MSGPSLLIGRNNFLKSITIGGDGPAWRKGDKSCNPRQFSHGILGDSSSRRKGLLDVLIKEIWGRHDMGWFHKLSEANLGSLVTL